jgi:hypothetical protein
MTDAEWRREQDWSNPPWDLLDDLVAKLRSSGAGATVIAPFWPKKPCFIHLSEMSIENVNMPPETDLFFPQKQLGQGGVGRSTWSVVAFRLPLRRE